MNRKCGQNVATDDRTFTDKDKVRLQEGSDYKDAMLNCESDFHQSEDKRTSKLNCHKLSSSYVTSILITKITSALCFCSN